MRQVHDGIGDAGRNGFDGHERFGQFACRDDLRSLIVTEVAAMLQFGPAHGAKSDRTDGFDDVLSGGGTHECAERLNEARVPQIGKEPACREG